ncbi:MAG: trigger factor [Candidatus Zambryskibacteria bacterium]|nr:trigger factor [Candidatus Zambryskibacteria bacterium]
MSKKDYTNLNLTRLPLQEVEITGEITSEKMGSMRKQAIDSLKKEITLPGFRKGNAPENLVISEIGDIKILEEAGEMALEAVYPDIISELKIDPIGKPEVIITKIGLGNPLGFKIKTALMPEVKLGDYTKIAKKIFSTEEAVEVTEKEVNDVIQKLRANVAHAKMHEAEGLDEHDHSHGEITDEHLPEVNEDFLSEIGGFASVEDLTSRIKENLLKEKTFKAKDKKRTQVLEEIITASTIEIPQVIVDGELEKMKAQFQDDLAQSNIKFEDYLAHIKKTESDLKTEWKDTAIKRAKSQIILNTVARDEGIKPEEEVVKQEMNKILSEYKDAERFRVRMYVETFLANDLVFKFLEEQK